MFFQSIQGCRQQHCPGVELQQTQVVFWPRLHHIHLLNNLWLMSANFVGPNSLWCRHSHTSSSPFLSLFFHLFPAITLSHSQCCRCCVWSPDLWPTAKQLPACLSIATKLLYIMAWSPAMQRGFMALEHAEWYLLSPGDSLGSPVRLQPTSQLQQLHKV